jgi:hypothetical protein
MQLNSFVEISFTFCGLQISLLNKNKVLFYSYRSLFDKLQHNTQQNSQSIFLCFHFQRYISVMLQYFLFEEILNSPFKWTVVCKNCPNFRWDKTILSVRMGLFIFWFFEVQLMDNCNRKTVNFGYVLNYIPFFVLICRTYRKRKP